MLNRHGVNLAEVRYVASRTISILSHCEIKACLFGSVACYVWGMRNRQPNDVDVAIMDRSYGAEQVKHLLTTFDQKFFLVPSVTPGADWNVLWYTFQWPPLPNRYRACKVDILEPGFLSIPLLPEEFIVRLPNNVDLPVMPQVILLLLKLRGWVDHKNDLRSWYRAKMHVDEIDIAEFLHLTLHRLARRPFQDYYAPEWLHEESQERVHQYVMHHPQMAAPWAALGFTTRNSSTGNGIVSYRH